MIIVFNEKKNYGSFRINPDNPLESGCPVGAQFIARLHGHNNRPIALHSLPLIELLAIRLSEQTALAKSLVIIHQKTRDKWLVKSGSCVEDTSVVDVPGIFEKSPMEYLGLTLALQQRLQIGKRIMRSCS